MQRHTGTFDAKRRVAGFPAEYSIDRPLTGDRDGGAADDVAIDPFALFIEGQRLYGRFGDDALATSSSTAIGKLDRYAWLLMMLGRDLESAAVNEEIIRRFSRTDGLEAPVTWARFNAGCAYARVGMLRGAIDQFNEVVVGGAIEEWGCAAVAKLAAVGLRQCRQLLWWGGADDTTRGSCPCPARRHLPVS
jgi:hypothetical protein